MRALLIITMSLLALLLSACQHAPQKVMNSYKLFQPQVFNRGNASISCNASFTCEFYQVNQIVAIDKDTHKPTNEALEKGFLRFEGGLFNQRHQYSLSLPAAKHEIKIHFYPESDQKAESFQFKHHFIAGQSYALNLYRKQSEGKRSLLNLAAPNALCIDLLQNNSAIRRFCRPYDVLTGNGVFAEEEVK